MPQWSEIVASGGDRPGAMQQPRNGATDLIPEAMQCRATCVPLRDSAIWQIRGPDAQAFLQSQTTNDVLTLPPGQWQLSGYCTPKGRLLASFVLWRSDSETFYAHLPASLADGVMTRLERYVLRAKVKIAPSSFLALGLTGSAGAQALATAGLPVPASGTVLEADATQILALDATRLLLAAESEAMARCWARLSAVATGGGEAAWDAASIAAGIATVLPATQEAFVPQMLNFDLVGALSYEKGCYPGQEIVARMHYLGKLKERLYRALVGAPAQAGDRLYSPVFGDQACGTIANAAPRNESESEVLAVLQTAAANTEVRLGSPQGPQLRLLDLPYTVPDANGPSRVSGTITPS